MNLEGVAWHLCSNRWNSAITEYALSLANCTSRIGIETIFTGLENSPSHLRAVQMGLSTAPLPSFGMLQLPRFLRIASDVCPRWIFVSGGPETVLSRFVSKAKTIRFRGQEINADRTAFQLRNNLAQSHIALNLFPSNALKAEFLKVCGSGPPAAVCELGVNERSFFYTDTKRSDPPEVVVLGRLDPVKGHEVFIEIFSAAKSRGLPEGTVLHIVGEAANVSVAQLQSVGKRLGLLPGKDFKFTEKRVENIAELMRKATLCAVSSVGSEVICRVAEEFLLCGTPIFVSGVGSLEECLVPGAGYSYKGLSKEDAANLLVKAVVMSSNESLQDRATRAQTAEKHFSLTAMTERVRKLIASL